MPVIVTNNASNAALHLLNNNAAQETKLLEQLASGSRIVQASDDAAGLPIGTTLQVGVAVFQQDAVNIQQGNAILQTADGALAQISNVLSRMVALASEAASGQVTNAQRADDIDTEYRQLRVEISSVVNSTTYSGQRLLSGSFLSNVKFLVGTVSSAFLTVSVTTVSAAGLLGGSGSTVSSAAAALSAISTLNSAIDTITQDRSKVGAYESQFNFSGQDIQTNIQNTAAAASVVMDVDVASVKARLAAADVKTQAAVAAATQAAQMPQELLRLIQS